MNIISRIDEIKTTIEKLEDWVNSLDNNFVYYNIFYSAANKSNDKIEIRTKEDEVVATLDIVWNELTFFNNFLEKINKEKNRLQGSSENKKQLIELNSIIEMFGCQ